MQQVKITVEVDGEVVQEVLERVEGTLEQMEDRIDAMTRRLAAATLQASVDRVGVPRPLFLRKGENCDTKGTKPER